MTSTRALSKATAEQVRAKLQQLAPESAASAGKRRPRDTMSGPYAGVLRALWLSAYNLGIVENRDDRALIAFVERQTRVSHPAFLHSGEDARKAIEALKAMISREAGVHWPRRSDVVATKLAIVEAQMRMIAAFEPENEPADVSVARLREAGHAENVIDGLQQRLGARLRIHQAKAKARG